MSSTAYRLLCITGTRADYGIYRSLLEAINQDKQLILKVVATGMHLLHSYGYTLKQIEEDGYEVIKTGPILMRNDTVDGMSHAVGLALVHFATIFEQEKPDCVLLLGDRGEMLAAAIAAHYQNITIFHLHGGELSGSADDGIRHAISKLADFHLVATKQAKQVLIRQGEVHERIFPIGSLRKHDVQRVLTSNAQQSKKWIKQYNLLSDTPKALLVMHPDSKDSEPFDIQIGSLIRAIEQLEELSFYIIGPNSDAGGIEFHRQLEALARRKNLKDNNPHGRSINYYQSLPPDIFLFLLSQMHVMVGNSSSGIIEAPFFHVPFVHVGKRQLGREHANTTVFVPFDAKKITEAVRQSIAAPPMKMINPYHILENPAQEAVRVIKQQLDDKQGIGYKTFMHLLQDKKEIQGGKKNDRCYF